MKTRVVILGAGFGGLELATILSETFGDKIDVVLVDKSESFVFGFSKLDVMFERQIPEEIHHYYRDFIKPGVRFLQSTIRSIAPLTKQVKTDHETLMADILVIALGADLDLSATPGLVEGGNEFYTVAGAKELRNVLPQFKKGRAVIGIASTPYKCPPAPYEAALLLHDYLVARGCRTNTEISVVSPFSIPVPPSPDTSVAILSAFADHGIQFIKERRVIALDSLRKVVMLNDGSEIPYTLFLGIPVHIVPSVVAESGLAVDGWIPVNKQTLETSFPGVYAVGDVAGIGTPKAGSFSEDAAKVVAAEIIAKLSSEEMPSPFTGKGSCYIEFGHGKVGRVDVDFFSGSTPTGVFQGQSAALSVEKYKLGSNRIKRWFGRTWC